MTEQLQNPGTEEAETAPELSLKRIVYRNPSKNVIDEIVEGQVSALCRLDIEIRGRGETSSTLTVRLPPTRLNSRSRRARSRFALPDQWDLPLTR